MAKLAKVSEWQFRMYRHELLWIYDMFTAHDEERAGFLGRYDVRRLMKYMGLEPYSRHAAPERLGFRPRRRRAAKDRSTHQGAA